MRTTTLENFFPPVLSSASEIPIKKKESMSQIEGLKSRAKDLIAQSKGYLYKSSIGILKFELKALEEGRKSELEQYVEKFEKKLATYKIEIDAKIKRDKEANLKELQGIVAKYSRTALQKRINHLEKEFVELMQKFNVRQNNTRVKTQREVQLQSHMCQNATERITLQVALEKYNEINEING